MTEPGQAADPDPGPDSFPSSAGAVVVGGGVMGCSVLYHLAAMGVSDALLLERNRLTSGTTWHSAAQVRQLRSTRNLTRLIQKSRDLYASLEAETGQATGWSESGSLSIATTPDRLTHIRRQADLARAYGVEVEEVGPDEIRELWPLARCDDVLGGVFCPGDGRVNPSDLCLALAKGARRRGGRVIEECPVEEIVTEGGRVVGVATAAGTIRCDRVVICAGLWSRGVALAAGVDAPLLPCEHFYLLTMPFDGVGRHLPTLSDHDSRLYIRDEVGGLLVGCFEPLGKLLDPSALGENFAFTLLPEDWDHFAPMMENALHRIPALETAQARMLLNGPESFTFDGNFILGEAPSVPGLFLGCGMNSVGMATAGGAGWALAGLVAGEGLPFDLREADPVRFHALENGMESLIERVPEVLGSHYDVAYPGRQWETARGLRLGPLHEEWRGAEARFGQTAGWERPLYFGGPERPALGFARPAWFEQVAREVRAAHEEAALFDLSTFGKLRVSGGGAEAFLDRVCANDMTRPPGRVTYTAMLNERGGFVGDCTVQRLSGDEYLLYSGTDAAGWNQAWLRRCLETRQPGAAGNGGTIDAEGNPTEDTTIGDVSIAHVNIKDVSIEDVGDRWAVLALMGPRAIEVAEKLGAEGLRELGYFAHAPCTLAGIEVRAARLSYVGEAGCEFTCAAGDASRLCAALLKQGVTPAGFYAQTSMRIEKRFAAIGHELDADVTPLEAGLGFVVKSGRGFIGAEALEERRARAPERRLASIILEDAEAVPLGNEPVRLEGELVGQVTSAAFGHRVGRPVALGYIKGVVMDGAVMDGGDIRVTLDIAGVPHPAVASLDAAFDPTGARMRGRMHS